MSDKKTHQVKLNLSESQNDKLLTLQERDGLARPAHAAVAAIERAFEGIANEGMATILTRIDRRCEEALLAVREIRERLR